MTTRRNWPGEPGPENGPDRPENERVFDPDVGEVYGPPRIGPPHVGPGAYNVGTGHSHARPVTARRKRKIWPWVVIAVVVLLFGSCAAIVTGAAKNQVATPSVTGPASVAESVATSTQAVASKVSFGNGQWSVPDEVDPGIYRSPGPDTNDSIKLCYVDTTPTTGGNIIAQQVSDDGPVRITVKAGQTVKVSGCQLFQKVNQ